MDSTIDLPKSEHMPSWGFTLMKFFMKTMDLFKAPGRQLNEFQILPGQTVIDYGCGPGRYIKTASKLVGENGKVLAVDIHEMAIQCVCNLIRKKHLDNVYPVKANRYFVPIQENTADLIYVLDVFHMISKPVQFLNEIHRLVKPAGRVILEDGHQKRSTTLDKLHASGRFRIKAERPKHLELEPMYK